MLQGAEKKSIFQEAEGLLFDSRPATFDTNGAS